MLIQISHKSCMDVFEYVDSFQRLVLLRYANSSDKMEATVYIALEHKSWNIIKAACM